MAWCWGVAGVRGRSQALCFLLPLPVITPLAGARVGWQRVCRSTSTTRTSAWRRTRCSGPRRLWCVRGAAAGPVTRQQPAVAVSCTRLSC
jgi:hypothetical protein